MYCPIRKIYQIGAPACRRSLPIERAASSIRAAPTFVPCAKPAGFSTGGFPPILTNRALPWVGRSALIPAQSEPCAGCPIEIAKRMKLGRCSGSVAAMCSARLRGSRDRWPSCPPRIRFRSKARIRRCDVDRPSSRAVHSAMNFGTADDGMNRLADSRVHLVRKLLCKTRPNCGPGADRFDDRLRLEAFHRRPQQSHAGA